MKFNRPNELRKFKNIKLLATWRKDLIHTNKARDNHFMYLGEKYDLTLLVPDTSELGLHILSSDINIVRVQTRWAGFPLLWFYLYATGYCFLLSRKKKIDVIWSVIGEEPIGWLFKIVLWPHARLVYDLWDIPGTSVEKGNSQLKEFGRKIYQIVLRGIIKHGDAVFACINKKGLENYQIPSKKIISSENGVLQGTFDPENIIPNHIVWSDLDGKFRLLYIGYLHETRGVFDSIRAVYTLLKTGRSVCLLQVGPCSSETSRRLQNHIAHCHMEKHVQIVDNIPSLEIPGIIAAAHVCLCPLWDIEKFRYSYPVKIYEYLAMGKPVIASRLPGIAHIVTHRVNGLLHRAGDTESLSACIEEMIEDNDQYLSAASMARASVTDKNWFQVLSPVHDDLVPRLFPTTSHIKDGGGF